ncbi:unnamed protein product [Didymodactylos carnosus]|uniref:Uncharacterized protein n=1 Tax=Didymodactylos carnosus TaxID=1234261 RepID=A0A814QVH2_9BILA|nr:unnamed protein product [Didymodactylos carnosus]CAF1125906.1 unnamed protein product [Didymodactylos carnosus]CAF3888507.1 unnamed protein product [Didymodactylos carnosus]CAF3903731.1 unnamed protein product [Didymodactylos carnosus]
MLTSRTWTITQELKDDASKIYSIAQKNVADTSGSIVGQNDRTGLFIALFLLFLLFVLILYLLYNCFSNRSLSNVCHKQEKFDKKATADKNNISIQDHLQSQHLEDDSLIDNIDSITPPLSNRYSQSSSIRSNNRQNSYKISSQASKLLTPRVSQILTTTVGGDCNGDIDSCIKTLSLHQELEPYSATLLSRTISKYYENKRKLTSSKTLARRSRSCEQLYIFDGIISRKSLTKINYLHHHRRIHSERIKGHWKTEHLRSKNLLSLPTVGHDFSTMSIITNNASLWKSEHLSKKDNTGSSIKRKQRQYIQPHHCEEHSFSAKQKPTTIYELFRSDKMRIQNLL